MHRMLAAPSKLTSIDAIGDPSNRMLAFRLIAGAARSALSSIVPTGNVPGIRERDITRSSVRRSPDQMDSPSLHVTLANPLSV